MEPVTLHAICDVDIARNVAQILLQRELYVRNTCQFTTGWRYGRLEPMDIVTLTELGLLLHVLDRPAVLLLRQPHVRRREWHRLRRIPRRIDIHDTGHRIHGRYRSPISAPRSTVGKRDSSSSASAALKASATFCR